MLTRFQMGTGTLLGIGLETIHYILAPKKKKGPTLFPYPEALC
jgi:hypothetical protein